MLIFPPQGKRIRIMAHGDKPISIAVIGVGFSGLMTAYHLLKDAKSPITLYLIDGKDTFGKGAAYSTRSQKHLLNVPAAKMSALPDDPAHFLNWANQQPAYKGISKEILGRTFLPRQLFGKYIAAIWESAMSSKREDTTVNILHDKAVDVDFLNGKYIVRLKALEAVVSDYVVLATGNETPSNPAIPNAAFYESKKYVKDPWHTDITKLVKPEDSIMILGNGLTAVDIIISIMETGYKGLIHTLSPSGFSILPHRHNHIEYKDFVEELNEPYSLDQLFTIGHKHFRQLHKIGITVEPIVDSLRPLTQKIWQSWSQQEKEVFVRDIRSMWNKIRHRIAPQLYDYVQRLRLRRNLKVHKAKLVDIAEDANGVSVQYLSKHTQTVKTANVGLVINCTGPHLDISRSEDKLLQSLQSKGMLRPDSLHIGMDVGEKWNVLDTQGKEQHRFYTLGPNLIGLLWETTAIPEIKDQAATLAKEILSSNF
jgi:uncharacterized NAD(P)/FAD-binding protein YdhS